MYGCVINRIKCLNFLSDGTSKYAQVRVAVFFPFGFFKNLFLFLCFVSEHRETNAKSGLMGKRAKNPGCILKRIRSFYDH